MTLKILRVGLELAAQAFDVASVKLNRDGGDAARIPTRVMLVDTVERPTED